MARGRKTGGRTKGTPNKKTTKLAEEVKRKGVTPLEYMLEVLRNEENPADVRMDAAKSAAPYVHSKMPTAIVAASPPSGPITEDDETLLDQYLNGLHADADES